ncbi:MAG TPA: hypothetical protein VGU74_10585 [Gemmatimonadales bacterium]|nr:hypothetical protein [Gemmatimonadales bacterium]
MTRARGRAGRAGRAAIVMFAAMVLAVSPAGHLAAQDSQFGIRGLGTPGKWESVRARSAGGAFAPFDAFSALTDASLIDARRLAGSITGAMSNRTVQANGSEAPLRGTRFPVFVVAGPLTRRIVVGAGFSTYLDRTFGIGLQDTIDIRGTPVPITDQVTSDGAVTDLRFSMAARVNRWIALGGGFHVLTGSTRVVATRTFGDTAYRSTTARAQVAYSGKAASVSALIDLTSGLRVSGWFRADSKLDADVLGKVVASNDLPNSYGTGVQWRLGSELTVAGTASWRDWTASAANGHNTFNWSFGTEFGQLGSGLRLGARGGQMPFGAGQTAPTEVGLSGGVGKQFSAGRGRIDFGVEHLERKGTGLNERVWTFLLGLTVRP